MFIQVSTIADEMAGPRATTERAEDSAERGRRPARKPPVGVLSSVAQEPDASRTGHGLPATRDPGDGVPTPPQKTEQRRRDFPMKIVRFSQNGHSPRLGCLLGEDRV